MGRFVTSSSTSVFAPLLALSNIEHRMRQLPQAPCIIIVPTHRQVEVVLRAWVAEHGGGEPPIVETMAGLYRRLGGHLLASGPTILHESSVDVLINVIIQDSLLLRSIGMEAQKVVRWTQYGVRPIDVQEMSDAAGAHTRRGHILAEVAAAWNMLLKSYEGGLCDRGTYARVLTRQINDLTANPLRMPSNDVVTSCIMLETHGVTVADRDLLHALSRIGWDVGISFANECSIPSDMAVGFRSATADDAAWFVANGWEHGETHPDHAEYEFLSVAFATREEEVRRVVASIKEDANNGISLRDVAICVPGASVYRQVVVDVARRGGLPLETTIIQPLVATHSATAAKCLCDLVIRNWLRADVERLASHDGLRRRVSGLSSLITVMQSERFLGGTSLSQWQKTLDEVHARAKEMAEFPDDSTDNGAERASRWLLKIDGATQALHRIANAVTLRGDVPMDALTFSDQLKATLRNLEFDRDATSYQELLDVLVQYTNVSERFGLKRMTLAEHTVLWWSMMEGASPLTTSEPGRGVPVLAPAELRCKDWKRVYVVGMVEGEFPRAQEHILDREIIPGVLEGMYMQSMMDIVNAVTNAGRLVCTRPLTIDEAATIPSSLIDIVGGSSPTPPEALDPLRTIALYPHELGIESGKVYRQPQTVHVRSIENARVDNELAAIISKELERPVSPSRLDVMVKCPYSFFAQKLLGLDVDVRSDESLTPMERGNMLHDVAAKFFQQLQPTAAEGASPTQRFLQSSVRLVPEHIDAYWDMLQNLARVHMRMQEWNHSLASIEEQALLGSNERPGLLRQWLALEIAYQQVTGHAPVLFEEEIVLTLDVPLKDGQASIPISARVDRVDVAQIDGGITFIVNDYKTTVKDKYSLKKIIAGDLTQMPIYIEAVRKWFAQMDVDARPWAAVYRSFGKNLNSTDEPQNLVVMRDPAFSVDTKAKGIKIPAWKGKAGIFSEKPLVKQNQELLERIASSVAELQGGEFAVRPKEGACDRCNYREVCRVDQWGTA